VDDALERRFLIVAGEASGDLHSARLVTALRRLGPCRVAGVTGPALERAGAERVAPMRDLAVMGFSAILPRLPRILSAYRGMLAARKRMTPGAAILVDSPGFNFRLGPALKKKGTRIFYYIAPQVWAWNPGRAARMAKWVDRLAVVFPFEEPLFRAAGVDARFVGHPLLDDLTPEVDDATLRAELGLEPGTRIVGLLPGSRAQEVRHHAPTLIEAASTLARGRPGLVFVLALPGEDPHRGVAADAAASTIRARARELGAGGAGPGGFRFEVVRGRTRAVQSSAIACAVASGTATLETALFGTPLVIIYQVGAVNYEIARRVIQLERIGLPNIVAGREVAPELIQRDFTAARVAAALAPWIDDAAENARARAGLAAVRASLGTPGASERAAALAFDLAAS
jgi:lipid-A-disaccharide synthase